MKYKKKLIIDWEPSVPDPKIFQPPASVSKAVAIKPPPLHTLGPSKPSRTGQDLETAPPDFEISLSCSELASNGKNEIINQKMKFADSSNSASSLGREQHQYQRPESGEAHSRANSLAKPPSSKKTWRPDVFAHAFVPRSYLAINNAPAKQIVSQAVEGINYATYVASFGSSLFLPQLFMAPVKPAISRSALLQAEQVNRANYYTHFMDCLMLDLEAQTPEVRSYDLFGITMDSIDFANGIFSCHVPGLRESAPRLYLGDIILVRQLIVDPVTKLPMGVDKCIQTIIKKKCDRVPGFTGCEITGSVLAVDKRDERLHVRLAGVLPIPLVFNVSFVVQGRGVYGLQRTIADVANELAMGSKCLDTSRQTSTEPLSSRNSIDQVGGLDVSQDLSHSTCISPKGMEPLNWLDSVLFPEINEGVIQTSLPHGMFLQDWYDEELNYEQMVCDAIFPNQV